MAGAASSEGGADPGLLVHDGGRIGPVDDGGPLALDVTNRGTETVCITALDVERADRPGGGPTATDRYEAVAGGRYATPESGSGSATLRFEDAVVVEPGGQETVVLYDDRRGRGGVILTLRTERGSRKHRTTVHLSG